MDMSFQDIDVDQMSNMECARNLAYSIQQRKIRQQSALRQLVSFLNAGRAWLDETHAEMSAIIHRRNKKWSRVSDSVETIIQNLRNVSIDPKALSTTHQLSDSETYTTLFDAIGETEEDIANSFNYVRHNLAQQNNDVKFYRAEAELFQRRAKVDEDVLGELLQNYPKTAANNEEKNQEGNSPLDVSEHIDQLLARLQELKQQALEFEQQRKEQEMSSEAAQDGDRQSGNWVIVDDWMEKKQQEQQVQEDIEKVCNHIRALVKDQISSYTQFQTRFFETAHPLAALGIEFEDIRQHHSQQLHHVIQHSADLESQLDKLVAYTELPNVYRQCTEEINRRVHFKTREYWATLTKMNEMLLLMQKQENDRRKSFFQSCDMFKNSKGHRAILSTILLKKLMPGLDKSFMVPDLGRVEERMFDELLPATRSQADLYGSIEGSWLVTGDSQIVSDHITLDGHISSNTSVTHLQTTSNTFTDLDHENFDDDDDNDDGDDISDDGTDIITIHSDESDFSDTYSMDSVSLRENVLFNQLGEKDREIEDLQNKINELAAQLANQESTSSDILASSLASREAELQEKIDSLVNELRQCEERCAISSEVIAQKEATIEEQATKLQEMQKAVETSSAEMERKFATERDELKRALDDQISTCSALQQKLEAKTREAESLQSTVDRLKSDLIQLQERSFEALRNKGNELKETKAQMLRFTAVIEDLRVKCQNMEDAVSVHVSKEQLLADQVATLEKAKQKMENELSDAVAERAKLEERLESELRKEQILRKEIAEMKAFIHESLITDEKNKREEINAVLRKQEEAFRDEMKRAEEAFAARERALQQEIERLQMQHEERITEAQNRLHAAEASVEEMHQSKSELQEEVEKMRQQLGEAKKKNEDLLGINSKLLGMVRDKGGSLKPNEVKIAIKDFCDDDIVLFIRKRNSSGVELFEVFHQNCPDYYLSPMAMAELKKMAEWEDLAFIRVRILTIDREKASKSFNPFKLPLGTVYHIVHPYPLDNPEAYEH